MAVTIIGASSNPPICIISGHCSATQQQCVLNWKIDDSGYSSATGGTIDITMSKPTYSASQFQACSPSTQDQLFVAVFSLSTVSTVLSPTPSPTLLLPSNGIIDVEGAPFYAIAVIVVACIMYGMALVRLRDASDSLARLELSKTCLTLGLFGSTITSEIAYVSALFVDNLSGSKGLASLILIARLFHVPIGCYVIMKVMGSSSNKYLELTDKEHLLNNQSVYMPLFIMILLDNTTVSYLPWSSTKFSDMSEGYPDLQLYKMCVYVTLVQSFVVVVIQIAVLVILQGSGFRSLNLYTQVFLCISIISSVVSFIVTMLGLKLQYNLLKTLSNSDNVDYVDNPMSANDDVDYVDNPISANTLCKGKILLSPLSSLSRSLL